MACLNASKAIITYQLCQFITTQELSGTIPDNQGTQFVTSESLPYFNQIEIGLYVEQDGRTCYNDPPYDAGYINGVGRSSCYENNFPPKVSPKETTSFSFYNAFSNEEGTVNVNATVDWYGYQFSQMLQIEKEIGKKLSIVENNNCIDIFVGNDLITSLCSLSNFPPPKYEVECEGEECPDGTCCECMCGDYLFCYGGNGVPIKKIKVK